MNKNNNFNIIRLFLSIWVMLFHIGSLLDIKILKLFSGRVAVESFFVISGYLVWQSYERSNNIWQYAQKRIRRLIPGYYFLTFLCTIVGIFLTTLSFKEYFKSLALYKFTLANLAFMNFLSPRLPGVFVGNPANEYVNGALWSLKIEICFYIFILIVAYICRKKIIFWLSSLIIATRLYGILCSQYHYILKDNFGLTAYEIFFNPNNSFMCLASFCFCGSLLYKLEKNLLKINWLPELFPLIIFLMFIGYKGYVNYLFQPLVISIIIIYFALYFPFKILINDKIGDLSYGIYIYHFVIIQIFINLNLIKYFGYINSSILIIICSLLCAYFSWHTIEKKFISIH